MTKPTSQRARPRIDLRVAVEVEHQSMLQKFYSRNLSSGGIYLELEENPPPIGTHMNVTFEVPQLKKTITAEAEVLHHHVFDEMDTNMKRQKRHGMGLKFVNLNKNDEELIQKYITGKDLHVRS